MKNELVIVIDFGGQYNQLVARRVRECNVYCEIYSYKIDIEKIKEMNPKGIILTGGPNSCYEPDSPTVLWRSADVACAGRRGKSCVCPRVWEDGSAD